MSLSEGSCGNRTFLEGVYIIGKPHSLSFPLLYPCLHSFSSPQHPPSLLLLLQKRLLWTYHPFILSIITQSKMQASHVLSVPGAEDDPFLSAKVYYGEGKESQRREEHRAHTSVCRPTSAIICSSLLTLL